MKQLLRSLLRQVLPFENGPMDGAPVRLLRCFRLASPVWRCKTGPNGWNRMKWVQLVHQMPISMTARPLELLPFIRQLVADYNGCCVTQLSVEAISRTLFRAPYPPAYVGDWVRELGARAEQLEPLEFIVVYGALEQCIAGLQPQDQAGRKEEAS